MGTVNHVLHATLTSALQVSHFYQQFLHREYEAERQGWYDECTNSAVAQNPTLRGAPTLGLMLCCHHIEIFNNFLNKGSHVFVLHWVLQILQLVLPGEVKPLYSNQVYVMPKQQGQNKTPALLLSTYTTKQTFLDYLCSKEADSWQGRREEEERSLIAVPGFSSFAFKLTYLSRKPKHYGLQVPFSEKVGNFYQRLY